MIPKTPNNLKGKFKLVRGIYTDRSRPTPQRSNRPSSHLSAPCPPVLVFSKLLPNNQCPLVLCSSEFAREQSQAKGLKKLFCSPSFSLSVHQKGSSCSKEAHIMGTVAWEMVRTECAGKANKIFYIALSLGARDQTRKGGRCAGDLTKGVENLSLVQTLPPKGCEG